jgi:hypothetical protein
MSQGRDLVSSRIPRIHNSPPPITPAVFRGTLKKQARTNHLCSGHSRRSLQYGHAIRSIVGAAGVG